MEFTTDVLLGIIFGIIISILASVLTVYYQNKQFYKWGYALGIILDKTLDKFIGEDRWEKIEDILLSSLISFLNGVKDGANFDNKKNDGEKS